MAANHHLLLIDDHPRHAKAFEEALTTAGDHAPTFEWVTTLADALETVASKEVWALFLNLSLPDSRGLDTFNRVLLAVAGTPVVVLGGLDDEEICKAAMALGARDYLLEGHLDSYAFARAIRNVLEREVARRELFQEKERAQVTLNSIGDAVMSTDVSGNVTYLNVVAEHMTGWTMQEAVGHSFREVFQIIDGVTRRPSRDPMELAMQRDESVGLSANCILVRRDGYESSIEDSAAPIHDRDGKITGAVVVFHDVSMARAMVQEMSHLAQHDVLTDLPNRLLLKDRLTQAISLSSRNQSQLALLFLDLDGFKNINDSLGHAIGDELLQSVGARLTACVRKSDTVSRLGGDEFVILLSKITHPQDAAIAVTKIIKELKRPHQIGEHLIQINGSIGLCTYPEHGEDAETLIKNADTAMYHVKEDGRDNYQLFDPGMSLRAVERQSVEDQLRYALARNELLLHYQPKVDLKTGAITSVEALLRWQHPERGLLLPGQFLSVAEDSGMIVEIGQWVLREACRQTREWIDSGLPAVAVAVNISSLEFRSERLLDSIRVALKETRLEPTYLELELTESVLMRHADSTTYALEQLKAIGVRLAVDDFGTGYSSLSYLTRFPIDALKLDQSFVHGIIANSDDAIIVNAVISMGKSLKHRVIAEGVETPEELEYLQAQGCDEGQGYYFSRPLVAQQFAKLLKTGISATVCN